jgi:ribosome-associated protein
LAPFADYFVICSGTSDRMLKALADGAVEVVHKQYQLPARIEGEPGDGWMLVDFGDVILHLFSPDRRDYYRLEELWSEGKVLVRLQ